MFLAALFKDRYKNIDVEHKQRVDNLWVTYGSYNVVIVKFDVQNLWCNVQLGVNFVLLSSSLSTDFTLGDAYLQETYYDILYVKEKYGDKLAVGRLREKV